MDKLEQDLLNARKVDQGVSSSLQQCAASSDIAMLQCTKEVRYSSTVTEILDHLAIPTACTSHSCSCRSLKIPLPFPPCSQELSALLPHSDPSSSSLLDLSSGEDVAFTLASDTALLESKLFELASVIGTVVTLPSFSSFVFLLPSLHCTSRLLIPSHPHSPV